MLREVPLAIDDGDTIRSSHFIMKRKAKHRSPWRKGHRDTVFSAIFRSALIDCSVESHTRGSSHKEKANVSSISYRSYYPSSA